MALIGVTSELQAAPELSVSAQGDCPSQRDLEAAVTARGLAIGGASFIVVTQTESMGATLHLLGAQGQTFIERHFVSSDCQALAEAVAVVVEAYFVEVRGPNSTVLTQPLPPLLATQGTQSERAASVPTVPMRGSGFFGLGPALALPQGSLTPQVELGGGLDLPTLPLSLELEFATGWPSISGAEPNRVRRWTTQGLFRFGVPFVGRLRYRPWAGLGLSTSELRALDVDAAPTKRTSAALVGGGFELAWPIGNGWLGRFDFGCLALTTRDTYRVEPDGEIGHGPRVVCSWMLGVGLGGAQVH